MYVRVPDYIIITSLMLVVHNFIWYKFIQFQVWANQREGTNYFRLFETNFTISAVWDFDALGIPRQLPQSKMESVQGYQYLETLVSVLSKFGIGIGIGIDQYLIAYIGIDKNSLIFDVKNNR